MPAKDICNNCCTAQLNKQLLIPALRMVERKGDIQWQHHETLNSSGHDPRDLRNCNETSYASATLFLEQTFY
jgi:hypothetical protein